MASVTANICSVNGTGPTGIVIHAETAMIAMESAVNVMALVREFVYISGLIAVDWVFCMVRCLLLR